MKRIHLRFEGGEEALFDSFRRDKLKRSIKDGRSYTWEEYFELLFNLAKKK
jgi:hypothetical protein